MRRRSQRLLVLTATLATAAMFVPTVPASAASVATVRGGCGFNTVANAIVSGGQNEGVIYDVSIAQEPNGLPLDATVYCWISVNGTEAPGTRLTAPDDTIPGVEFGQRLITFGATDTDSVTECEQVVLPTPWVWVAPDGNVGTDCPAVATLGTFPPPDHA